MILQKVKSIVCSDETVAKRT